MLFTGMSVNSPFNITVTLDAPLRPIDPSLLVMPGRKLKVSKMLVIGLSFTMETRSTTIIPSLLLTWGFSPCTIISFNSVDLMVSVVAFCADVAIHASAVSINIRILIVLIFM